MQRVKKSYISPLKSLLYPVKISYRAPAFGNETFLCDIKVEHIQHVVDGFDFPHFNEPNLDILGSCHQHPMSVVLGLPKHLKSQGDISV